MDTMLRLALALVVIAGSAAAQTVVDGDTIKLNGTTWRLRGIDAPEFHQSCLAQRRRYMERLPVNGKREAEQGEKASPRNVKHGGLLEEGIPKGHIETTLELSTIPDRCFLWECQLSGDPHVRFSGR